MMNPTSEMDETWETSSVARGMASVLFTISHSSATHNVPLLNQPTEDQQQPVDHLYYTLKVTE